MVTAQSMMIFRLTSRGASLVMIGAMPAVAVRHDRRKLKDKPKQLLLKPYWYKNGGRSSPRSVSRQCSQAGTPLHERVTDVAEYITYGDECCYGKTSLLHFIIFFLLGGLTLLIIGAVQFKGEAGLSQYRYHFLLLGGIVIAFGTALLAIKLAFYRIPTLHTFTPGEDIIKDHMESHHTPGPPQPSPASNTNSRNNNEDCRELDFIEAEDSISCGRREGRIIVTSESVLMTELRSAFSHPDLN